MASRTHSPDYSEECNKPITVTRIAGCCRKLLSAQATVLPLQLPIPGPQGSLVTGVGRTSSSPGNLTHTIAGPTVTVGGSTGESIWDQHWSIRRRQ